MAHQEVFRRFTLYFPDYAKGRVESWIPNGKNSIRLQLVNKEELIFTCYGQSKWRFETLKSFLDGRAKEMRKGKNNE